MLAYLLVFFLAVTGLARAAEPESFAFDHYQLAEALSAIQVVVGGRVLICPEGGAAASAVSLALGENPQLDAEVLPLDKDGNGPETIEDGLIRLRLACGVRVNSSVEAPWHLEGVGRCGSYWPDPEPAASSSGDVTYGLLDTRPGHAKPGGWGAGKVVGVVVLVVLGVAATAAVAYFVVLIATIATTCGPTGCFTKGTVRRESPWAGAAVSGGGPPPLPVLGFRF